MSLVLSTGLTNFLLGGGSVRKAFEDALLNIYSGVAPSTADEPPSGVLLNTITKASGAVAAGARSTRQIGLITIGSNVLGQTFIINITVDGVGPTSYTFTVTAAETTVALVAMKVAQMLNDIPQLAAIASGSDGNIFVASRFAGLAFTMASGGGSGTISRSPARLSLRPWSTASNSPPQLQEWKGKTRISGPASASPMARRDISAWSQPWTTGCRLPPNSGSREISRRAALSST